MRLGETLLDPGWSLAVADAPDDTLVAVLEGVRWGTDGLRFRTHGVRNALARETGARFATLRHEGVFAATMTLVPRTYTIDGVQFSAWYRTMLAVPETSQGNGAGLRIAQAVRRLLLDEATEPVLLYGYVEAANTRSLKVQERVGYTSHATFEAVSLGPLRARTCAGVEALAENERQSYLDGLAHRWAGHVMSDFDQSLRVEDVVVLKRGGAVVAGAQVLVKTLTITSLAGLTGALVLGAAPLLARLSPLFALAPTRLAWCGNLFWRDDPRDLIRLIEHVQAEQACGSAVLYLDPRSANAQALRAVGFGVAALASPPTVLHAMAGQQGLPPEVVEALHTRPRVLSPLDSL